MNDQFSTLVELLRWRALKQPDQRAYTFLVDGETEEVHITYGELDRQARAIAACLQDLKAEGERALLIYPPGIEYIAAFFGCLCAGVIAVPVYPPYPARLDQTLPRLLAIAKDSQAKFVLTTQSILAMAEFVFEQAPDLKSLDWIGTDNHEVGAESRWIATDVTSDTLAFLQYTSGSTGNPKAVMISHGNLLHNIMLIDQVTETTTESRLVNWLPQFHDMGLVSGFLSPLYKGFPATHMSPLDFLKRPLRWLQAISKTRTTHSGGPNFAYDLCVRKITPEQKKSLDLSSWAVAWNGAEPIRIETMNRFAQAFESCGFRRDAFMPCYGLAECTVGVCWNTRREPFVNYSLKTEGLQHNSVVVASVENRRTQTIVGCGRTPQDQTNIIVNPETFERCAPNQIGEIWVSGPSVAQGYWNRLVETKEFFQAYLKDTGEGPFLRTGDLGFIKDGELFVTGRLKDLIIIRGENYYPQDIERTVESCYPGFRPGCGAAFSVEVDGEERPVMVQEIERCYFERRRMDISPIVDRRSGANLCQVEVEPGHDPQERQEFDADAAIDAIRKGVAKSHELELHAVVFLKAGTVPKTSSGKIQRRAAKAKFLGDTLEAVALWISDTKDKQIQIDSSKEKENAQELSKMPTPPVEAIQDWLISRLSELLKIDPNQIDIHEPFANYGLVSVTAVEISNELEDWLGRELPATLAYTYPTIDELAHYLAGESDD